MEGRNKLVSRYLCGVFLHSIVTFLPENADCVANEGYADLENSNSNHGWNL